MIHNLLNATQESLFLVLGSAFFTLLIGLPLGIIWGLTGPKQFLSNHWMHHSFAAIFKLMASVPYIIVMIFFLSFTRWLLDKPLTPFAALLPLILAAVPGFAQSTAEALEILPQNLRETMLAFGGSPFQILYKVLIPEALPKIIQGFTKIIIQLIGYSTVAGALGSGGLGNLAMQKGFQNFDASYIFAIIFLLIGLVLIVQFLGHFLVFGMGRRPSAVS